MTSRAFPLFNLLFYLMLLNITDTETMIHFLYPSHREMCENCINFKSVEIPKQLFDLRIYRTLAEHFIRNPVHLRIHAIIQSANQVAEVQCIKLQRFRSGGSVNVHIFIQWLFQLL